MSTIDPESPTKGELVVQGNGGNGGNGIVVHHMEDGDDLPLRGDVVIPSAFDMIEKQSRMLAHSSFVPDHLVDKANPLRTQANCFRVAMRAHRWGRDVFDVADCTYVTRGKLGYEGKLVASVVNTRAGLRGRLTYDYSGSGEDRTVTVSGHLRNEAEPRTITLSVRQARTGNEMWAKDPDQKLAYCGAIRWARRHVPEVLDGVLTEDDLEAIAEVSVPPADTRTAEEVAAEVEAARKAAMQKQRDALKGTATSKPADAPTTSPPPASQGPAAAAKVEAKPTATPITDAVKASVADLYKKASAAGKFAAADLTAYLGKCGAAKLSELTDEQGLQLKGLLFNATTPAEVGNARTEAKPEAKPTRAPISIREPIIVQGTDEDPHDRDTQLYTQPGSIGKSQHARIAELMKALPASAWPLEEKKAFLAGLKIANIHGLSNFQAGMLIVELEKLAAELGVKVGEPAAA